MNRARKAYREADAQSASGARMVVLLYEQMIQDLTHAAKAMDENNIEYRTNRINHALDVLCVLEGTLNFKSGGAVAHNLENFYKTVRASLWKAQLAKSKHILMCIITDLFALRDAWAEVDRAEAGGPAPKAVQAKTPAIPESPEERAPATWSA